MAELNISNATTTNLSGTVQNYSVGAQALDFAGAGEETFWYFKDATKNFGYAKSIPEIFSGLKALTIWTAGKGYEVQPGDMRTKQILEHIDGWGEDTFQQIMQNHIFVKKAIGDAFAEVIREDNEEFGKLINLKPISPERMRTVVNPKGRISGYDVLQSSGEWKRMKKWQIFHSCNDRIADEIHGNSVIDICKWIIDAIHEALADDRMIKHRDLAMGILYADTSNTTKLNDLKARYADAIKKGEVLVLPKNTAELRDSGVKPSDRIAWIQLLKSYLYEVLGVPKIIATSEGYTEAGGKVGFLTFEPTYTNEQTLLEQDLWNQLGIKITFNRPPSLSSFMQESEGKNTGQVSIQQNELTPSMVKNE